MGSTFRHAATFLAVGVTLSLFGCGGGKTDRCKDVSCPEGQTCAADTGTCTVGTQTDGGVDGGTDGGSSACDPACAGDTPVCDEASQTCVVCTASTGCGGQTPICDTRAASGAGACVQCRGTVDCTAPAECDLSTHTCLVVPGHSCGNPQPLEVSSGNATFEVDTSNARNTLSGKCGGSSSPELIYSFSLSAPKDLTLSATAASASSADPTVYLRVGTCSDSSGELLCANSPGAESIPSFHLAPGSYFLVVENEGGAGKIDVSMTLADPPPPPSNDLCATPTEITFTSGATSFSADTTHANDDLSSQDCNFSSGGSKDVVYHFKLSAPQDVTFTATAGSSSVDPVLYLRSGSCGAGAEVTCRDQTFAGESETLRAVNLAANVDYYLVVETFPGYEGVVNVTGTLSAPTPPPANDTCAAPEELTFTSNAASFSVNTTAASDDLTSQNCNFSSGPSKDAVYHFNLAAPQDVTFVASPGTSDVNPVLYLRRDACSTGTEVTCSDQTVTSQSETLTALNLPANVDFYLVVETTSGADGVVNVSGTLSPPTIPPSNDTCAAPVQITSLPATLSGTTAGASNDYRSACGTDGRDVVYQLDVGANRRVTATVTPATKRGVGLTVRDATGCAAAGATNGVACATNPGDGQPVTVSFDTSAAATYFLIVDSGYTTQGGGAFTLDVSDAPVANPSNDTCASASAIALTTTGNVSAGIVEGTTVGAASDTTNNVCGSAGSAGPDVMYTFTTPSGGPYTAKIMLQSENALAYLPLLDVRNGAACTSTADADQLLCEVSTFQPYLAQGLLGGLTGSATIDVIAESADTTRPAGPFKLEVELASAPSNDACSGATALTANATVTGNTLGATNDYDAVHSWISGSNCAGPFGGPDVVYTYQAATSGTALLTVTPESGYDVEVGVLSSCAQNACVATADVGFDGEAETLSFPVTQGNTYVIVIDSFFDATNVQSQGAFAISIAQ